VVFGDETLRNIAAQRPGSIQELARIPGLGPGRLDRYGAAVLALCATAPPRIGADEKKAGSRA
jgi:DNA helicase-2/ATP-dependent DNA helicase PcrA